MNRGLARALAGVVTFGMLWAVPAAACDGGSFESADTSPLTVAVQQQEQGRQAERCERCENVLPGLRLPLAEPWATVAAEYEEDE